LNGFDVHIELFLNHFVGQHPWFDWMVSRSSGTPLGTTIEIVLLMWFVIFDRNRPGQLRKGFELLIGSSFFALLATLAARGLAISLPFRARPIATPSLHLRLPAGGSLVLIDWSSFPSDHAALFFALATGILLVSRRVGYLAVAWVSLFICFPAIYMGVHWPTDVLAGMFIGVSFAQMARIPAIREFVRRSATKLHEDHPEIFFMVFFLFSYETVVLFEDVRRLLQFIARSV
jgi:undecaprenyl-diphosphatase